MFYIRTGLDYHKLRDYINKTGNEVNGTYELLSVPLSTGFISTKSLETTLGLDKNVTNEFKRCLFDGIKTKIGPYITEKYLFLIPALKSAMTQLKTDCSETRRCIISFPEEHCFQSIQFILRERTVHVSCFMRSCDVYKNLPYDLWICSFLADLYKIYCRDLLGMQSYDAHNITFLVGSLHAYKEDSKHVL